MSRLTAKELASAFSDFVNSNNTEKFDDFVTEFTNQHRTLQQSGLGLMLKTIERMASDEYRTDPRNEDSKKVAQSLMKGFIMAKREEFKEEGLSNTRVEEYLTLESVITPSRNLGFI